MAERPVLTLEHALTRARSFRNDQVPLIPWLPELTPPTDSALDRLRKMEEGARKSKLLTDDEISFAINLARERGLVHDLFSQTIDIVRGKAPYALTIFDELDALGNTLIGTERLGDRVSEEYGVPVTINGAKAGGGYFHDAKRIAYEARMETDDSKLGSLASMGEFPEGSQLVSHERTHAAQFNLGIADNIPPELAEAQAYRVGAPFDLMEHSLLIQSVLDQPHSAPLYSHLNKRKFHAAVYLIDRLNALGYSQEGIVQIISNPGEWDKRTGFWTDIYDIIEKERERRGLDRDGLEKLVMVNALQKSIDVSRARVTAQRVLYDAFEPEIRNQRLTRSYHRVKPGSRHPSTYTRPPDKR